jgi:hypothetical protein
VLLTGFGSGGQQVYLTADAWQAAVKAVAPGLQVFKALPVDGLRPNLRQTLFCTAGMSLQPNVFSHVNVVGALRPFVLSQCFGMSNKAKTQYRSELKGS